MRLVHLADLHLGFRQYQRLTPTGINQREADVAHAFRRAIDRVIALAPDIVVIAGDVFHTVRPTNPAIIHAFTQFARLACGAAGRDVVMVAGNHDTPRATETGCILRLFAQLGIHVVVDEPRANSISRARPLRSSPCPTSPVTRAELHARSHGAVQRARDARRGRGRAAGTSAAIAPRWRSRAPRSRASRWGYIALGHYHVLPADRAERVLLRLARVHEHRTVGRARQERVAGCRARDSSSTTSSGRAHVPSRAAEPRARDLPPISARGLSRRRAGRARFATRASDCERRDRGEDRAAHRARRAAPHRARARSQARCASSSGARCTFSSTRAVPDSTRPTGRARRDAGRRSRRSSRHICRAGRSTRSSTARRS